MHPVDQHPGTSLGVYQNLLGLPPVPRMIAGAVCLLGGGFLTSYFWERGVIAGFSVFFYVAGLFLFFSGLSSLRKQKKRRELLASFEARKDGLVDGLVAEKREGRNPVRWLNDQGIHDPEMRTLLLDAMNERLKSPPAPGK